MKALVLIPTYNEKGNISRIIEEVFKLELGIDMLVIDDNSPDGTGRIVAELMETEPFRDRLFLLSRPSKQGLGPAYKQGFAWGLEKQYEVLVQMDADLSHDPKYLPDMIGLISTHDFVIGSRYVANGGVEGWGAMRKVISRGGSLVSRIILKVPFRDYTGGFNVWRSTVLRKIDIQSLISNGYSFLVELKYKAARGGFRYTEYPIVFVNRVEGVSKMSFKIFFEAFRNLFRIAANG
jgi:dolichol-phosphate mannosyltransferase